MRAVVAALMLLFQLQPVVGSAACLGLFGRQTRQGCEMPDHGRAPVSGITLQSATTPQNCQLAAICGPASLAIPVVPLGLESPAFPFHRVGTPAVALPHDISLSPPARPPSA
jgi:hypothetical protein